MNALELLKQDHQKVAGLFAQTKSSSNAADKQRLFEQIKTELETHTYIEETVFYPALERHEELRELTREAYEEHSQVKTALHELAQLQAPAAALEMQLASLQRDVEHHVEEEENEIFPQVQELFGAAELEAMGRQMESAKSQFKPQFATAKVR
jgi:iron-sulfur cluster repair protein YtfE (RIC family)